MRVEVRALQSPRTIVSLDDRWNLVDVRDETVVVFIPDYDNGVVALLPCGRGVDGGYDVPQLQVTEIDESGIESRQGAVIYRVEVALWPSVAAAVLIGALVGSD